MPQAARIGDRQTCLMIEVDPNGKPYAHDQGSLDSSGKVNSVFINGQLAAVQGDTSSCTDTLSFPIATVSRGSASVFIQGQAAARFGDTTDHPGGSISSGSPNVNIGG